MTFAVLFFLAFWPLGGLASHPEAWPGLGQSLARVLGRSSRGPEAWPCLGQGAHMRLRGLPMVIELLKNVGQCETRNRMESSTMFFSLKERRSIPKAPGAHTVSCRGRHTVWAPGTLHDRFVIFHLAFDELFGWSEMFHTCSNLHHLFLYPYISVSLYIHTSISISPYVYPYLYSYLSISLYIYIHISLYIYI